MEIHYDRETFEIMRKSRQETCNIAVLNSCLEDAEKNFNNELK
jgi:hypothetical protein